MTPPAAPRDSVAASDARAEGALVSAARWYAAGRAPAWREALCAGEGGLTRRLTLTPSRALPPYALAEQLSLAEELAQSPHPHLPRVLAVTHEAEPSITAREPAAETLAEVLALAGAQGWGGLPLPVALAVALGAARALAHLHALGFTHGALAPRRIWVGYGGEVLLGGLVEGACAQLSPEGADYGRGPAADSQALAALLCAIALDALGA